MAWTDNGSNLDFGFAFNNIKFSDRVIRIEIGDNTCPSLADKLCGHQQERTKKDNELVYDTECGIEVKTIHVSSIILAAKSPFFFKLFSNGMKESEEHHVTLRIHSLEEVAFMDLINFMYNNTLSSTLTTSTLLDVLMVADKFQVSSCIIYCINLLLNFPMTCESALQFLHLPSSVTMVDIVQPLMDAAKKYLVDLYKDFTNLRYEEQMLELPLPGIEAVLSSDDLQVTSEDVVYEFVLKWARIHYPMIEERRGILTTGLASLIRFEYMTGRKLEEILACNDFDPAYVSNVVLKALLFKQKSTHLHTLHASRAYTHRPVKVLESMFPHPHCIVYLDLRKEEFDHLLPNQEVYSENFCLGGKWFYLSIEPRTDPSVCCGLFLYMSAKQSGSCSVVCEFLARSKPTEEFGSKAKWTYTFTEGKRYGILNLFKVSWSQFIAPESIYLINGVLYLKAEIAMKP